jgi:hypothetical protein
MDHLAGTESTSLGIRWELTSLALLEREPAAKFKRSLD